MHAGNHGAPSIGQSTGPYRWVLVGMLWAVALCNYADRSIMAAVLPQIRHDYGFSSAQLGLLSTAFLWVYAFSAPLGGVVGDYFRKKWVIVVALVFWSVVTLLTPLASGVLVFVLLRALTGLGEGFNFPSATALIARYHGPTTRSRAFAWHQTGVICGSIVGSAAAGFLAEKYHWHVPFVVFGIFGFIIALLLVACMRDIPVERVSAANKAASPTVISVLRSKPVQILAVLNFGALFVVWTINTWLPTYLHDRYHLSLSVAATIGPVTMQLATMVAVLVAGVVSDRLVRRTPLARFYVLAFGLICGSPFIYLAGNVGSIPFVIACLIAVGFFKGLFDANIFAAAQDILPISIRATGVGIVQCVGILGGGIAPFLVGLYAPELGLGPAMGLTALFYFGAGALVFIFRKTIRNEVLRIGGMNKEIAEDAYAGKNDEPRASNMVSANGV